MVFGGDLGSGRVLDVILWKEMRGLLGVCNGVVSSLLFELNSVKTEQCLIRM